MAGVLPGDVTLGTSSTIGKYFGIVSVIPSVLTTTWLYLVWVTGALTGDPHLDSIARTISKGQPGHSFAVAGLALVLALIIHPLQFAIVQVLEGYWGATAVGRAAQTRRMRVHVDKLARATGEYVTAQAKLKAWDDSGRDASARLFRGTDTERTETAKVLWESAAANLRRSEYPDEPTQVMPTRLGNMLRRYELRAGSAYHLPILDFATHLGMVAEKEHGEYVADQRNQLDLTARICASMLVAAALTSAIMWPHRWWLLVALIPYAAAYVSYRGAISSATAYGQAFTASSDLNRFRLYEALHLAPVADSTAERSQNDALADLLAGNDSYQATFRLPDGATAPASAAGGAWRRRLHGLINHEH